jgi:hypothetical protein
MPKIIDYVEYRKTEAGWVSRKVHDSDSPDGAFEMKRGAQTGIEEDIAAIEAGRRPSWTILGLPRIIVNGQVFKERDEL